MSCFYQSEYTDDGCSIWKCSECDFCIDSRGYKLYKKFKVCPSCLVVFTHSEQANEQDARERRMDRSDAGLGLDGSTVEFRYSVRAIADHSAGGRFDNEIDRFFMVGEDDTSIFRCCSGVYCTIPPKDQNEPHIVCPEPFIWYNWDNITRAELNVVLQRFHGWPVFVSVDKVIR